MQTHAAKLASVAAVAAMTCNGRTTPEHHFDLNEAKEIAGKVFERKNDANQHASSKHYSSSDSSCPQSPSGHRIESLPYWAEEQDLPCFYSGMLSSSDSYENYFFYWLAPRPADLAEDDSSSDAPLIIYLNGGPGSSSMNALWTGNGPLRVYPKDSSAKGDEFEVKYDTSLSW